MVWVETTDAIAIPINSAHDIPAIGYLKVDAWIKELSDDGHDKHFILLGIKTWLPHCKYHKGHRIGRNNRSSALANELVAAASLGTPVDRELSNETNLDGGAPLPPRISTSQSGDVTQGLGSVTSSSKPKKVHTYDGKSSWTDYLVQFNITATMKGWTESQKAMELATSLVGVACGVLSEINEEGQLNFGQFVEKLSAQFEP